MSMSAFPHGVMAAAGVVGGGIVTLGNFSSTVGYDNDGVGVSFGSLSGQTEINGLFIQKLLSNIPSADFQLELTTGFNPGQSHFTSITIQDGAGNEQTFNTVDATFNHVGGAVDTAFWSWGDGTSPIWIITDVGEDKEFTTA